MQSQKFSFAKPRIVLLLLAGLLACVLAFAGVLRYSLRTAFPLHPADYVLTTPAGFHQQCTVRTTPGALVFEGWALMEGERFHTVDNFLVLYNTQDSTYLKLPTAMQLDESAGSEIQDAVNYSFGGFYAFVLQKQLKAPLEVYEICIAYRSTFQNALVHTGQFLQEVA